MNKFCTFLYCKLFEFILPRLPFSDLLQIRGLTFNFGDISVNPFQNGPFWFYLRMGEGKKVPLRKSCHTRPTMMKLARVISYLKETQKTILVTWHTPLSCAGISIFSSEIIKFCCIREYRYRLHFGT